MLRRRARISGQVGGRGEKTDQERREGYARRWAGEAKKRAAQVRGKKAEEQTNRIMDNIKMDLVKMRLGV